MHFIWAFVSFIIVLWLLIGLHEWGHYWVARLLGIRVLCFAIGFGKPIISWTSRRGIKYILGRYLLGGYVKLRSSSDIDYKSSQSAEAFDLQSPWRRILVALAGPAANLLIAIVCSTLVYWLGISTPVPLTGEIIPHSIAATAGLSANQQIVAINKKPVANWQEVREQLALHLGAQSLIVTTITPPSNRQIAHSLSLVHLQITGMQPSLVTSLGIKPYLPPITTEIGRVLFGSPAANAGLRKHDHILAVNQQRVATWDALLNEIQRDTTKQPLTLTVQRSDKTLHLIAHPLVRHAPDGKSTGYIGIESLPIQWPAELLHTEQLGLFAAFMRGSTTTWETMRLSANLFWQLITGRIGLDVLSGPIGIATTAGSSARAGISYYLEFLALVSVSLALLNSLPIPLLDGGNILYYVIEWVRKRPLSLLAQWRGMQVGALFLLFLMACAFYNDLSRFL